VIGIVIPLLAYLSSYLSPAEIWFLLVKSGGLSALTLNSFINWASAEPLPEPILQGFTLHGIVKSSCHVLSEVVEQICRKSVRCGLEEYLDRVI
jgi:hypothetical protein